MKITYMYDNSMRVRENWIGLLAWRMHTDLIIHNSVNDLITWSVFLWAIWLSPYFCERFDHMICISANDLIESIFLWTIWSHDLYFCNRIDWVFISVNDLITWSVFLPTIWLSPYFCERFVHMFCISVIDLTESLFL